MQSERGSKTVWGIDNGLALTDAASQQLSRFIALQRTI
jgi:hypothetical protein